ncbi:helix-turn-helix domain-containing protein [Cupriavidus basilensis]
MMQLMGDGEVISLENIEFESDSNCHLENKEMASCTSNFDKEVEEIADSTNNTNPMYLPRQIANAIVAIYEGLEDLNLSQTQRRVFACLIRYGVKQDRPSDFMFIKKVTIASKTKISEATVYRSLASLEAIGLIAREEQRKTAANLKVVGRIRLGDVAIQRLGLADSGHSKPAVATQYMPDRALYAGAATGDLASVRDVNLPPLQSSTKKQPATPARFTEIQGKTVPADLAWLVQERQLRLSGLFLLMKLARTASQRLSDVVAATRHALAKLEGKELFAYLAALVRKPVDFTHIAKSMTAETEAKEADRLEAQRRDARLATLVDALRGKTLVRADGATWSVDEASLVVRANGVTSALPHARALEHLEVMLTLMEQGGSDGPSKEPRTRPLRKAIDEHLAAARAILRGPLRTV